MVNIVNEIFKKKQTEAPKSTSTQAPVADKKTQSEEIYFKCWICLDKIVPTSFDAHLNDCFAESCTKNHLTNLHDELSLVKLVKTLNSHEQYLSAVELLTKIVNNIVNNPDESKYQRLRCSNKAITEKVFSLKFGLKLLEYLGFVRDVTEDVFIFQISKLGDLNAKLKSLEKIQSLNKELYSRNQIVILPNQKKNKTPTHSSSLFGPEVDDSAFEMSIGEMTSQYQEIKRKNDLAATLMTSKQRQALNPSKKPPLPLTTNLRFLFPDKTTVQANFLLNETMRDVFSFLRSLVDYPKHHFKLYSTTNRKCYEEQNSKCALLQLQQEEFYPNSTFHFKWDDNSNRSHMKLK